jgi:glycosyltransferase involved in cell wall biosynthesis
VWLLAHELTRLGHAVTVFGAAGSDVAGEFVATLPGPYARNGSPDEWRLCDWITLTRAVAASDRFDVVHTHAYLWGIPLERLASAPMLHTHHIMPGPDEIRLLAAYPGSRVVAISHAQWRNAPAVKPFTTILHGIDLEQFPFRTAPEEYVLYLGSFTPGKGPVAAIQTARSLGIPIRLAGPRNDYFTSVVEPLVDGVDVEYVGYVQGEARSALVGKALALLYPVTHPEPFGFVLAEAMACGTPVAATSAGAVPEVVDDGVTGTIASSVEGLADAVLAARSLDRATVHARAQERFSGARMAREYETAYRAIARLG